MGSQVSRQPAHTADLTDCSSLLAALPGGNCPWCCPGRGCPDSIAPPGIAPAGTLQWPHPLCAPLHWSSIKGSGQPHPSDSMEVAIVLPRLAYSMIWWRWHGTGAARVYHLGPPLLFKCHSPPIFLFLLCFLYPLAPPWLTTLEITVDAHYWPLFHRRLALADAFPQLQLHESVDSLGIVSRSDSPTQWSSPSEGRRWGPNSTVLKRSFPTTPQPPLLSECLSQYRASSVWQPSQQGIFLKKDVLIYN